MANIKENFVLFSSDNVYNQHISELTPESLAFVIKKGEEKLITQNKSFYFIPTNGNPGQVLKARDGYFSWGDLYSVRVNNSVGNLRTDDAIQVITLNCSAETTDYTIKFINDFTVGGNCTLYLTEDNDSVYHPTVKLDRENFISLNGQYEIPLNKGKWMSVYFFCTGGYIYFTINDLGNEVNKLSNRLDNAYLLGNGHESGGTAVSDSVVANNTNVTKNVYEFAVGKYNASSRGTSGSFGSESYYNTIFVVGNGLDKDNRHDAFQIGQKGEVMIVDLSDESPYYKKESFVLQNKLKEYEDAIKTLQDKVAALESANEPSPDVEEEEEQPEGE